MRRCRRSAKVWREWHPSPVEFRVVHPDGEELRVYAAGEMVRGSGGHFEADSEPGRGTTFRICLPRIPEETVAPTPEPSRQAVPTGREIILVVEDEALVRRAMRRLLERLGYRVLEAADHQAAEEWVERHAGPIDLLVADVVIPELSGPRLANRLTARRPEMRSLFVSGYPKSEIDRFGSFERDTPYLTKPIDFETFDRAVREALDRHCAP